MPDLLGPEHPSGSHNIATIREAVVIADAAVAATARSTRLQWMGLGLLGSITLGVGAFLGWCLITLGVIGAAQAQGTATANAALEQGKSNSTRIEAIDAGARAAIERLERKIDANNEATDKKLVQVQATMDLVLQAVRKR